MIKKSQLDLERMECSEQRRKVYVQPILILLNHTGPTEIRNNVHSFQSFEGGSYPTTHGPS